MRVTNLDATVCLSYLPYVMSADSLKLMEETVKPLSLALFSRWLLVSLPALAQDTARPLGTNGASASLCRNLRRIIHVSTRATLLLLLLVLFTATPSSATVQYYGEGKNTTLLLDFNIRLLLEINDDVVTGHFDATESPGAPTVCGRSDFTGDLTNREFSFTFTSKDDDIGCGPEDLRFEVSAIMSPDGEKISGSFVINDGESQGTWAVFRGTAYLGGGRNTTAEVDWLGGIVFSEVGANRVVGYLDADGIPGESTICGAGLFAGTLTHGSLTFSYISNDLDPGCGFDFGVRRDYSGIFSTDGSQVNGIYTVESGSEGIFSFNYQLFGDGFESGTLGCWSRTVGK